MKLGFSTGFARLELWVVPLLMVLVALNQVRLARLDHLSPWKGGGFGMFATVDGPRMRALRCSGAGSDGVAAHIEVGADLLQSVTYDRLTIFPTADRLERATRSILGREVVVLGEQSKALRSKLSTSRSVKEIFAPVASLDVPVYRTKQASDYDIEGRTVSAATLEVLRLAWDAEAARVSCVSLIGPCKLEL